MGKNPMAILTENDYSVETDHQSDYECRFKRSPSANVSDVVNIYFLNINKYFINMFMNCYDVLCLGD